MDLVLELSSSFESLLAKVVHTFEADAGGDEERHKVVWSAILDSGFLDLLCGESQGGAGISFAEAHPLLMLTGAFPTPYALAETMVARAVLGTYQRYLPTGPILLLSPRKVDEFWYQPYIPEAHSARHALIQIDGDILLVDTSNLQFETAGRFTHLRQVTLPVGVRVCHRNAFPLGALAALVRAVQIAGAADRVLKLTTRYALDRVQFGKPIAHQQAVQQQIAVLAEKVVFARFASARGCTAGLHPTPQLAAVAKIGCSAVAADIADIAHAVHGAMGMTAEYQLGEYTQRLRAWAIADGAQTQWARNLGGDFLSRRSSTPVDYIRTEVCGDGD